MSRKPLGPATTALHEMDPTGRFSARAGDYRLYRPSYPPAAIDAMLDGLGDPASLAAADVGAGTGLSSRLLAERGVRVASVEPNAAMRGAADPHPLVAWHDAPAEATGLPDRSVDLVLCAQSFHWFRPDRALAEFRRLLRPRGRVALMWNDKNASDPITAEYGRLVEIASDHDPAAADRRHHHALFASQLFTGAREREFAYGQSLSLDGLIGRAISASYVPRSGPKHEALIAGLTALHSRSAGADGSVRIVYRTHLYLAEAAATGD